MSKKITSDFNHDTYLRDLKGYAGNPPKANWPGGAKIARSRSVRQYAQQAGRRGITPPG